MTNLIDFYFSYGEAVASAISSIAHGPGRRRFVKVTDLGSPQEFERAAQTELPDTGYVLVWEMFTDAFDDAGADYHHSLLEGSFVVCRKTDKTPSDKLKAYAECRAICQQVLGKLMIDAISGPLEAECIKVPMRNLAGEGTPALATHWYGWAYTFRWVVEEPLPLPVVD
ncbi:hypothetical protein FAES_3629 [Fibrella aestuarina BUZ 2]|uniref:Uncharacterized protein n=1 Tax=Fibrella aestuarina BUZ 2 TaxID=1166018 RepID=I0KBY3_9BACT|nr:hypothetical protein [Fibrella aestuarina]CCH01636.1 hypothetical protein FAES_3629 [Fibrella aestuarina BUZ 2]